MALNAGFAASIVMFFTGTSMVALVAGSAVFGVSQAGGDILWSLWVTKFSPPHRIADDMSVHTFTTGLRGVIAPFLAFRLIDRMSIGWMGVLCSALIVAATMVLLPELRNERMRRRGELSVAAP